MEPAINASNYKHYLSKYSNLVTSGMRMNNFLELKLSNQQQVLLRLKTLLIKYASLNSDKKDMSSELKRDIIDWNEIFKENNAKLQSDITNLKLKSQYLATSFTLSNTEINKRIEKEKEFNFIIGNVLLEKEAICKRIQKTIKQIQNSYLKRANEEEKELCPDEALEYFCNDIDNTRNFLYHESRNVNKHINKKIKLNEKITDLKIELFNQKNATCLSERKVNRNQLSERRGYCDNKTIPDQSNLEDSITNDADDFDEINLDSDEDNNFEEKSFVEEVKLDKERIMKIIPYLNLKQILFNKEKFRPEIDENSIERRNRMESIADEIDEMKDKIRLLKKVFRNNKKKEMNYTVNINKMNKYLIDKSKRKSLISN